MQITSRVFKSIKLLDGSPVKAFTGIPDFKSTVRPIRSFVWQRGQMVKKEAA